MKYWDPKTGKEEFTVKSHNNTINWLTWNWNGNWLLSGSKDNSIKLYDFWKIGDENSGEMLTFKDNDNDVTALEWHPIHEELFVSAGNNGTKNPHPGDNTFVLNGKLIYWLATGEMI